MWILEGRIREGTEHGDAAHKLKQCDSDSKVEFQVLMMMDVCLNSKSFNRLIAQYTN